MDVDKQSYVPHLSFQRAHMLPLRLEGALQQHHCGHGVQDRQSWCASHLAQATADPGRCGQHVAQGVCGFGQNVIVWLRPRGAGVKHSELPWMVQRVRICHAKASLHSVQGRGSVRMAHTRSRSHVAEQQVNFAIEQGGGVPPRGTQ